MDTKKINILFDASVIANALAKNRGRTGIFFVAINVLKELLKRDEFNVELYCSVSNFNSLKKVVNTNPIFAAVKVAFLYSKLEMLMIDFLRLKDENKQNKGGLIQRVAIKVVLQVLSLLQHFFDKKASDAELEKYDVFFSGYELIPDFIAKCAHIKKYTILHDVTPILFPQYFAGGKDGAHWFFEFIETLNAKDYYFANSEHTKQDFIKHVPSIDPDKVTTTLLAAGDDFYPCQDEAKFLAVCEKYNIPAGKKYLFSLCSIEPRKNLIMAIKSFIAFVDRHKIDDFVYVLGGGAWDSFIAKMQVELPELKDCADKIIRAGYIDDEDLASLYSNSEFFVYTSEYEGFGLPPLEAMQCGKAVLASNNSSLPEVIGDAGMMIEFDSFEQHIEAYEKLYFDKSFRMALEQKSIAQAKQFSWTKCVDVMACEIIKNAK